MSELIAFIFPGQGSQSVGMGAEVYHASPAARAVFAIAERELGFPLSHLCFFGPEDVLVKTINTQPALVATSLAVLAALQEAAGASPVSETGETEPALAAPITPAYVAGHSVGEYAALATAGALSIAESLRLVRERGRLMHEAGTRFPCGMAAVLGMDPTVLREVCTEASAQASSELTGDQPAGAGQVVVANDNAPGQIVISGAQPALELAMRLAKERGARRVVALPVSGAFHSPVMTPASAGMADIAAHAPLRDAHIPVISNITAQPMQQANTLRAELARQIESPVQWTESVKTLGSAGVTTFLEIGSGQVLTGLIRRILRDVTNLTINGTSDISSAIDRLGSTSTARDASTKADH